MSKGEGGNRPRQVPAAIRRLLRQEAGFGCCKCGNPLLEYHHIRPWHEVRTHNPDDMIALCPTCHDTYGRLEESLARDLKACPKNLADGRLSGRLYTNAGDAPIHAGGNILHLSGAAIAIFNYPLLSCHIHNGVIEISVTLFSAGLTPTLVIHRNDVLARVPAFIDLEHRVNYLSCRDKLTGSKFYLDFRNNARIIGGILTNGPLPVIEIGKDGITVICGTDATEPSTLAGATLDGYFAAFALHTDNISCIAPHEPHDPFSQFVIYSADGEPVLQRDLGELLKGGLVHRLGANKPISRSGVRPGIFVG